MSQKKIFFLAIGILILVTLISGTVAYFTKKNNYKNVIRTGYLRANNPDFAMAEKLLSERKTAEAIAVLEKALPQAKNFEEEAYLKHDLALAYSSTSKSSEDYKKSITLYKEIIAHLDYPLTMKALSIEGLDRLLASSVSEEVSRIITSDEPYKSMGSSKDTEALRLNLLNFGKSFYPLAGIEARRTALSAKGLYEASKNSDISDEMKNVLKEMMRTTSMRWERQVADAPHFTVYLAENLMFRAVAAQYYTWTAKNMDLGDPGKLYEESLAASDMHYKPLRPLIEYNYAVYLSRKDDSASREKMHQLLKRYETASENAYMAGVFKKEKTNLLGERENLIHLASLSPSFKSYLEKLGWQALDFSEAIAPPRN